MRLIPNNLKSPYTDQFSVGIRQRVGILRTSLSYSYIIGKHQVGYAPLNRSVAFNAEGRNDSIQLLNSYGDAVAASFVTGSGGMPELCLVIGDGISRLLHESI